MFFKRELINLDKDSEESRIAVRIAGESLVPAGPLVLTRVKINDATQEGKDLIKKLRGKGWRVESITN